MQDFTCNTALLAELFDCTPRNIGHYIASGMPVRERGKAGREHVFDAVPAFNWHLGMRICEQLRKKLPPPLETVLVGFFSIGPDSDQTFNERQRRARRLVKEMGYSTRDYDAAVDYLLTNHLIRWC